MTAAPLQIIQAIFPEFSGEHVVPNILGQYNDVYIVDGTWAFRFPKFRGGAEQLQLETALLPTLAAHLSLPVPLPEYTHIDLEQPQRCFCGYRLLPGEPFWPVTAGDLPAAASAQIARQLGRFLHELHHLPAAALPAVDLPLCDTTAEWEDIYERIQLHLFPLMRLDACKATAAHFESYLAHPALTDFQPALRHGDFGATNILFDAQRQVISGILDFSFTTLGDPAVDFAGLLMYGEPFVRGMSAVYPTLDALWPRITFYKGTFALLEALYGVEHSDEKALQAGLADYM